MTAHDDAEEALRRDQEQQRRAHHHWNGKTYEPEPGWSEAKGETLRRLERALDDAAREKRWIEARRPR